MLEIQRLDTAATSTPQYLPPSTELPDSDDIPVDKDWSWRLPPAKEVRNEDQNWIPNVLLMLLKNIWTQRTDWFFGVDMGVYHTTPILSLEMVSWTPGGEYDDKMSIYAKLGVLYYVIYNPEFWQRDRHQPLEVYKLVGDSYQLQIGEPFWMPEVSLGIGRCPEIFSGSDEEVLSWFDEKGDRYLRPEEKEILAQIVAIEARQEAIQSQKEAAKSKELAKQSEQWAAGLAAKLRELGIDPDVLK